VREKLNNDEFEYYIYAVKYEKPNGGSSYRAGDDTDQQAIEEARKKIESDFNLLTFLSDPIEVSSRVNDPTSYGMKEWRDIFNPRQLVAHYEFLRAFETHKEQIQNEYNSTTSDAILTLLAMVSSKMIGRNSRLSSVDTGQGLPDHIFKTRNFSLCRIFSDNNLCADTMGYKGISKKVIESYEELVEMVDGQPAAKVLNQDAAELGDSIGGDEIQAAVIDPPYYDSVLYAQLSDIFYVLQKEYLSEIHTNLYNSELTNKQDEAIADPSKFEGISGELSKKERARKDYEDKMAQIFGEIYEVMEPGGVLTIMFT
jgi:adenine-specific DNA methylase